MGILTLDITGNGVVMSADSQPVEILAGETHVLSTGGSRSRNAIVPWCGSAFRGLVGYVGTEAIGGVSTTEWLRRFVANHLDDALPDSCEALAAELTAEWKRLALPSVLEIFVSGVEGDELRFWYVRNSEGLDGWRYKQGSLEFRAADDLDPNYIKRDLAPNQTKEQLLATRMYSFWQGELDVAAPVFMTLVEIMGRIYAQGIKGFQPIATLDDLAYYVKFRLEFVKRLYSPSKGIYSGSTPPLGGDVFVFAVARSGEILQFHKNRGQAKSICKP